MSNIPLSIVKYIRSIWMSETVITYLHIDQQHCLIKWGGHPEYYGLVGLKNKQLVTEQVSFLDGLLDAPNIQVLEFISVNDKRSAHIHIIPSKQDIWVLILNATNEHEQQQKIQQQVNELSILTYRQSQLLHELELTRQQLLEEKQQLEQTNEIKNQLISRLSDKLHPSVNSIIDIKELLHEVEEINVKQENRFIDAKNNTNHLLSLIDNILEQTTLKMGQEIKLNFSHCYIKDILAHLKSLFIINAQNKKLEFNILLENQVPSQLIIDESIFRQILINLISNAFKFTKQGFVQVQLDWKMGQLIGTIVDSGAGIAPNMLQEIKTVFEQNNAEPYSKNIGSGLMISHHLVKLVGGTLTVDSVIDQGSTFQIMIPAQAVQSSNNYCFI